MPDEPTHDGTNDGTRPPADRQRGDGQTAGAGGRQTRGTSVRRPQGRPANRSQGGQSAGQQRREQPSPGRFRNDRAAGPGHLRNWVVYITTLLGIAGVGTGVLWILLDTIDEPIVEPEAVGSSDSLGELIGAGLSSAAFLFAVQVLVLAMLLVLSVVAVFLGAWLGRTVRKRNGQTFLTAGLSVAAGTAVLFGTVSVLLSVGFDGLSLNPGGVLIHTSLTALFAGATAAGGAAATRHLFPGGV
jgi:hypothetical protein